MLFLAFAGTDSLRLMTQLHSFGMTKKYKLAGIDCFLLQQDLAGHRRADGRLRAARTTSRPSTPTRTCRPSTPSSRRSSASTPTSPPAPTTPCCSGRPPSRRPRRFDSDKVAEAHEGMCLDNTHIGRQCIRKEDHQVVMDMHLYQVEKGKNMPIAAHRRQRHDRRADGRQGPGRGLHVGDQEEVTTRRVDYLRRGPAAAAPARPRLRGRAGAAGAGPDRHLRAPRRHELRARRAVHAGRLRRHRRDRPHPVVLGGADRGPAGRRRRSAPSPRSRRCARSTGASRSTGSSSPSAWPSSSARACARSGAATCGGSCRRSPARRRCSA